MDITPELLEEAAKKLTRLQIYVPPEYADAVEDGFPLEDGDKILDHHSTTDGRSPHIFLFLINNYHVRLEQLAFLMAVQDEITELQIRQKKQRLKRVIEDMRQTSSWVDRPRRIALKEFEHADYS